MLPYMELSMDTLGFIYGISEENVRPFVCQSSFCNLVPTTKPYVT